ncbi:MAG: glycosyl transferase [Betaproteobacteria bacterium]|nr:MAG: glycosyl transferase [Betaproteobacteria bacterium]
MPAKNEASSLDILLPQLGALPFEAEIIVVDDGSTDATRDICLKHGVKVISNPYGMGNGAAIKAGARAASGEVLLFMDADGQHRPEDIPSLLQKYLEGYDMVVGARQKGSHANAQRAVANDIFSRLASWMVDHTIPDLTSGMRVVNAEKFRRFLYLLPNGFSYPTSITMCFFRVGYSVAYVPIHTPRRIGRSHIRPLKDGMRFMLIIFKIGALYSPLKLFLPLSLTFFALGLGHYLYTYLTAARFTNMSALLLSTSVLIFLIGIVSEQITMLNYRDSDD